MNTSNIDSSETKTDLLTENGLPIIKDENDFSLLFEFGDDDTKYYFGSKRPRGDIYYKYSVQKRSGGNRELSAIVDEKIRACQYAIDKSILRRIPCHPACHSYIRGKSILTNANCHMESSVLLKFDIVNFFGSISYKKILSVFLNAGYGKEVSKRLSFLCMDDTFSLPQGAITSPMLSNLACRKLDKRIYTYCEKYHLRYTRYADDLTISSVEKLSYETIHLIRDTVNSILESEGFKPNHKKFKWFVKGQRMFVTGLVLGSGKLNVKKEVIDDIENSLFFIRKNGIEKEAERYCRKAFVNSVYDEQEKYINHLIGLCLFVKMVNRNKGDYYLQVLKGIMDEKQN